MKFNFYDKNYQTMNGGYIFNLIERAYSNLMLIMRNYVFLLTLGMRQEHTILLHLVIILEELASAIRQ